ncbi:MAG: hypothetical protein IJI61_09930 [Oscillospiraceae bacterium]|nr:hypothetical protein [Oscillospiraceae bacterium]
MLKINQLTVLDTFAAAKISDGIHSYQVEIGAYEDKRFRVTDASGTLLEQYPSLERSVHSRYFPVFLALQKNMNICNTLLGGTILEEITGSISFSAVGERYTASNLFQYRGKEYIACAEKDYSAEIPSFFYTVSDTRLQDTEGYEALYHALDSEFYPVLADLDRELDAYIEGKQREEVQK